MDEERDRLAVETHSLRIDIGCIIKDKAPKLYKKVPHFAITWLKNIIHQDDINVILERYGHLKDVEFITAVLNDINIRRDVIGQEHIQAGKRYIFASNHPLGGLDGFALAEAIERLCGKVKLVVNDLLMNLIPIKGIFTPINKHGRQNPAYIHSLNEVLQSDVPVIYFPAGLCSRRIKGRICDLEWKKTFVQKAIDFDRDIIPVYVSGKNSNFFYTFANVRKALGIKVNIEMILLPAELFKKKDKGKLTIIFGEPISVSRLRTEHTPLEWASVIKDRCYELAKEVGNGKRK